MPLRLRFANLLAALLILPGLILHGLILHGLILSRPLAAEVRATPLEARAMAEQAAGLIAEKGPAAAFAEFMRPDSEFRDRELFVVVMEANGTVVAHGARPAYVGQNFAGLRDVNGDAFVTRMLAAPKDTFVAYYWQNPLTEFVERKVSYVVHCDRFVIFVGAYVAKGTTAEPFFP